MVSAHDSTESAMEEADEASDGAMHDEVARSRVASKAVTDKRVSEVVGKKKGKRGSAATERHKRKRDRPEGRDRRKS